MKQCRDDNHEFYADRNQHNQYFIVAFLYCKKCGKVIIP